MVLGRDPFSNPAADAEPKRPARKPGKARAKSTKARPSRPTAKKPAGAKEAAPKAPAAKRAVEPAPAREAPPTQASPRRKVEHARGVAEEIQRRELLEKAYREEGPVWKLFRAVTRYLRPSTYGTRLGEMGMNFHSEEVGPFGFDPGFWKAVEPFFRFLFDSYWRIEISGLEHLPASGRALLVANHSGSLPYDGIMLRMAIEARADHHRAVRFLVEDFIFHFPFLGSFVNRVGGVRACQDNAARLLDADHLVGVFPEGVKGIGKLYKDRYRLQRFGRGGFIKLAMRTQSPIVPVAIVGAEEIHPMFSRLAWLARSLGLPYLPVTPTFPWLGPLGALPLPSKWLIRFGEPITFGPLDPKATDTPLRLMDKVEMVRGTIQQMIDELLEERKHPFLGD